MGLFKDLVEGFASGFATAARAGSPRVAGRPGAIEACCAQLGWGIDERVGSTGIILHFNDPIVNIRKVLITVGESGHIAVFSTFSPAQFRQVPPEVMSYLLQRNSQIFQAWQMTANDNGTQSFAIAQGVFLQGMTAPIFKASCEMLVKEASDFDSKLRQAGVSF